MGAMTLNPKVEHKNYEVAEFLTNDIQIQNTFCAVEPFLHTSLIDIEKFAWISKLKRNEISSNFILFSDVSVTIVSGHHAVE